MKEIMVGICAVTGIALLLIGVVFFRNSINSVAMIVTEHQQAHAVCYTVTNADATSISCVPKRDN